MIKIIKNIQALSTFKQNRLSQKLSKLSVALAGAEADISDKVMEQRICTICWRYLPSSNANSCKV
jgi:hypothetical protein